MATDQNQSSDSTHSKQGVIPSTEKAVRDEQNSKVYNVLSGEVMTLAKKLVNYHSENNSLKKMVKRLERDVKSLETELEDLDECVDRETVIDLIHEIVPSLINEKSKGSAYSSESSEESDSDDTHVIRKRKDVAYAFIGAFS
ncbi:unnamed protein product [Rhizophagus irregularis]|uniref:Uncharacterized protein n=1 Tax=Rhizophagus irregularis TaxID=588596 RepID=A0A2I1GZ88_9GLOM|nr:hypothetical protein RhiirA4_465728 [Rhizophagus irregularis]PKY51952.1 hypothetical protein RhiirA4_469290 [Rhizophagus irregularis]CAB4427689.1 unnamed protein product [Rhizophagus irregularis]